MKVTPEKMQQLGQIVARCDLERMLGDASRMDRADAVMAGLVAACAILLPRRQWDAATLQWDLHDDRLSDLAALVPGSETPEPAADPLLEV